jgi:hypothetical protein
MDFIIEELNLKASLREYNKEEKNSKKKKTMKT